MPSSKKSSRAAANTGNQSSYVESQVSQASQSQSAMVDMARQQLALSADAISAISAAAGAIQQIQQQLAQRVAQRHEQAAQRLRSSTNPSEVLAVQIDLFTSGLQEAAQYWQQVAAASMRAQPALTNAASAVAQAQDTGQQQVSAAGNMMNPMLQAWQSLVTSPLNGSAGSTETQ